MGDKVEKDLCDERSGNIQTSLKEIKEQLGLIWGKIDKIKAHACNGDLSTKKTVALIGGTVVIVQAIAELVKGFL